MNTDDDKLCIQVEDQSSGDQCRTEFDVACKFTICKNPILKLNANTMGYIDSY